LWKVLLLSEIFGTLRVTLDCKKKLAKLLINKIEKHSTLPPICTKEIDQQYLQEIENKLISYFLKFGPNLCSPVNASTRSPPIRIHSDGKIPSTQRKTADIKSSSLLVEQHHRFDSHDSSSTTDISSSSRKSLERSQQPAVGDSIRSPLSEPISVNSSFDSWKPMIMNPFQVENISIEPLPVPFPLCPPPPPPIQKETVLSMVDKSNNEHITKEKGGRVMPVPRRSSSPALPQQQPAGNRSTSPFFQNIKTYPSRQEASPDIPRKSQLTSKDLEFR
jgi:hypothetical protein